MTGHIRERVLMLVSDERDILWHPRPEQDPDQDLVANAPGALLASPPRARCSLNSEEHPMPGDSRDCTPAGPIAALCEATALKTQRPAPLSARAAAHHCRSPVRPVLSDLPAVRRLRRGVYAFPPGLPKPRRCGPASTSCRSARMRVGVLRAALVPLHVHCWHRHRSPEQLAEHRSVLQLRRQRHASRGRAGSHDHRPAARGR